MPGFNGRQRLVDIPAATTVAILATGPTRKVRIIESTLTAEGVANTPVGLEYQVPNDGSASGFTTFFPVIAPIAANQGAIPRTIELGDDFGDHGPMGSILGNGPGQIAGIGPTPATTLCKVKAATAAATSVIVWEWF